MSDTHPRAAASTNFQLIFDDALNMYKKRTKNDLLTHPIAEQLEPCESPSAILVVLRQQVQGPHLSQNNDDRLTRWLDPIVNVLFAFSATFGEAVGSVCYRT